MNTPDTTESNDSTQDTSLSHLPDHIRRAIEITPAAGTRERIIDITTRGRRTGRPVRIEIFFYRAAGTTHLCRGAGGAATDWGRAGGDRGGSQSAPVEHVVDLGGADLHAADLREQDVR
ncbi:hypothetical protein ACFQ1S_10625 [Kibdelosporangium lantanae]|uniref:Uncharacterized protein n=1 Tax=Kibdelosporangium lantanae TaxID=1497396 RepID=A0ABW3M9N1_9PSEU